jgi:hypothetical protein
MSALLRRNAAFIKLLHKSPAKVRKSLLRNHCSTDFVRCICECAKNLLKGNVPLTKAQKLTLRRRKRTLRQLALKKTSGIKRRRLIQTGGFLGAILGPIVSVLGQLFGGQ